MYWEHVDACATVCAECGILAVSYLDDGGVALAKLFRMSHMKSNPLIVDAYTSEAENQIEMNKEFYGDKFNENSMLWFREMVCDDCLKKHLIEKAGTCIIRFDTANEEYIYGDILIANCGNPLVDFVDFIGACREQLQWMMIDCANAFIEQLNQEFIKEISGEAYEMLISADHHGIKKEKFRLFETYSHQAMSSILKYLYTMLECSDEYKQLASQRKINYQKIKNIIDKYPNNLSGYFAEEDLVNIKIGCMVHNEVLNLGMHCADEIDNPSNVRFYSGLYETNMRNIKEIIHSQPELCFEWDEDSIEIFRKRLVRKLRCMNLLPLRKG
ncbi:MAG: hypothetical protein KGZ75_04210 [Syntrophomonadaceae bacterium]|nr:hypothetical protein [Syntrophomonadaceae bacterium]